MHSKLIQQLLMVSKYVVFGTIAQCIWLTVGLAASTNAQDVRSVKEVELEIGFNNVNLEDVFLTIESLTDFDFVYHENDLFLKEKFTMPQQLVTVEKILLGISRSAGLAFKQVNNNISVQKPVKKDQEPKVEILLEARTITGKVIDIDSGEGLPGVNIVVKGTSMGTVSDVDGNFTINVPDENDTLVFSSIGYLTEEIAVAGKSTIDVTLAPNIQSLQEVVVIGYGTRTRENLAGSVASVGEEVIESRPITNAVSALQGQIPGLIVQRSTGQPGLEGFNLNVRGFSSTNGGNNLAGGGNMPLVLIDGVPGSLNLLNPEDIESISVLKDASASIYGSRGANGVVLVTTKQGKKGTPSVSYSSNVAVTKLSGMMETPNHYQYAIMDNEANIHNGSAPMYTPDLLERIRNNDPNPIPHPVYGGYILHFPTTDWRGAVFDNGFQHVHNLNVSGGGENASYYLSGSYINQQGVIRYADDNNQRYNLRLNYDYNFSDRIRLESKLALENQQRSDVGGVGSAWLITESIFGMPYFPIYTQSGTKYFAQGGWGNAVAMAREAETATYNTRNVNTNFKLIGEVLDGLTVNLQAGINHSSENNRDIAKSHPLYTWDESSIAYYSIVNPNEAYLYRQSVENVYQNFTGYFQYSKSFTDKHQLDIMGGASHEENDWEMFEASRDNFPTDEVWSLNLGGTQNMQNNGAGNHWAIRSLFSRVSYIFNNRYILEANLRYDGSSRFQSDTRWGLFPGISAAWRLSEENFIKNFGLFDDLKLRASYGETGNQEGINLYDYLQLIEIGERGPYPFGAGRRDQSASLAGMVSLGRTWETIVNQNAGIDMTMFSSKLNFSFDYFIKRNKNMLIPVTYPSVLGATPPFSNSGELKTWGFETSVGWQDKIADFQYSARLILSDAKNELVDYGGQDTYTLGLNQIREGYPINTYFAYEFDGIIRTEEELAAYSQLEGVPSDIGLGDAMYKDLNGDGRISPYSDTPGEDGDVINVGNTAPRYNFGVNLGSSFRNFDLSVFIQGIGQRTLFREGEYSIPWSDWWRQPPLFYYGKTWSEDRPDAPYPKLSHGNIRYWNYEKSTLQQVNAAYVRLKNLQIGYVLPSTLLDKLSISRARIYLSGENLWELHGVEGGWDPESSTTGFNYPFQRMYSFGLDVTF